MSKRVAWSGKRVALEAQRGHPERVDGRHGRSEAAISTVLPAGSTSVAGGSGSADSRGDARTGVANVPAPLEPAIASTQRGGQRRASESLATLERSNVRRDHERRRSTRSRPGRSGGHPGGDRAYATAARGRHKRADRTRVTTTDARTDGRPARRRPQVASGDGAAPDASDTGACRYAALRRRCASSDHVLRLMSRVAERRPPAAARPCSAGSARRLAAGLERSEALAAPSRARSSAAPHRGASGGAGRRPPRAPRAGGVRGASPPGRTAGRALPVGLGELAEPALHRLARRRARRPVAEQRQPARRAGVLAAGASERGGRAGAGRRAAGEHERQLAGGPRARPAPRCRRRARRCRCRAAEPSSAGADLRRAAARAAATPSSSQAAATRSAAPLADQDPGADAHRRGQLEHPQHVEEALGPAEVGDQERRADGDRRAAASSERARASARLPAQPRRRSPSSDEAPASPPAKKYQAISGFQTGGLMIGRP